MAIRINKVCESDNNFIETDLYGSIKIIENIDYNNYSCFDSYNGYKLFISQDANNLYAIKENIEKTIDKENISKPDISKDCELIEQKYNVDKVKYDDTMNSIIVKVLEDKVSELDKIESDFKDNKFYEVKRITPQVLFLELKNVDIQLEDDSPLDKISDQDMKNIITKAGVKLNGTENKDRLKGIMQGVLSTAK